MPHSPHSANSRVGIASYGFWIALGVGAALSGLLLPLIAIWLIRPLWSRDELLDDDWRWWNDKDRQ